MDVQLANSNIYCNVTPLHWFQRRLPFVAKTALTPKTDIALISCSTWGRCYLIDYFPNNVKGNKLLYVIVIK